MEKEIYTSLQEQQSKYIYYLLSIAAGCIALTLKRTENLAIEPNLAWVGLAILFWGVSFVFGCYNRLYNTSAIYANFNLLKVQSGGFQELNNNPQKIEAASEGIRLAIAGSSKKISRFGIWQWRFLIFGAIFYIVWHVLNMMNN